MFASDIIIPFITSFFVSIIIAFITFIIIITVLSSLRDPAVNHGSHFAGQPGVGRNGLHSQPTLTTRELEKYFHPRLHCHVPLAPLLAR